METQATVMSLLTPTACRTSLGVAFAATAFAIGASPAASTPRRVAALPCAAPTNGTHIVESARTGLGELSVTNGYGTAVLLQLTRKGKTEIAVFIRKRSTFTIKKIPDGIYTLFYRSGSCWDSNALKFVHPSTGKRFEQQLNFVTKNTATETQWSTFSLKLNSGTGNAKTTVVEPPPLR